MIHYSEIRDLPDNTYEAALDYLAKLPVTTYNYDVNTGCLVFVNKQDEIYFKLRFL